MTTIEAVKMITEPGVYPDIEDALYHADPVPGGSLSTTGAKAILKSPAHFRWQQEHRVEKREFDLGSAIHHEVLGTGWPICILDFDSYKTKAAQVARDAAREDGQVPILIDEYETVRRIAAAVLAHPLARSLLTQPGVAESSAFAQDPETGVWLRARFDYLHAPTAGRTTIVDLKSARSADPSQFSRAAAEFGYDIQDPFYKWVLKLARGDYDPEFKFIVVETSAPHLVSVVELDAEFEAIGRQRMRRAIDAYARCVETGEWPGYPSDVNLVGPPRWLAFEEGMEII